MTWNDKPGLDTVSIRFQLVGEEAREFRIWAARELRQPTKQVLYLLRQEMARRRQADYGRLPDAANSQPSAGANSGS